MGCIQSAIFRRAAENLERQQIQEQHDLAKRQQAETMEIQAEHESEIQNEKMEHQVELDFESSRSNSVGKLETRHEKKLDGLELKQLKQKHRLKLQHFDQTHRQQMMHDEQKIRLQNEQTKHLVKDPAEEDELIRMIRRVRERSQRIEKEKLEAEQDNIWLQRHKELHRQREEKPIKRVSSRTLEPIVEEGSPEAGIVDMPPVEV